MDMYKNKKSSYKSRISTDHPRQLRVMILTKTATNISNYFVMMQGKLKITAILTFQPIASALRTQFKNKVKGTVQSIHNQYVKYFSQYQKYSQMELSSYRVFLVTCLGTNINTNSVSSILETTVPITHINNLQLIINNYKCKN